MRHVVILALTGLFVVAIASPGCKTTRGPAPVILLQEPMPLPTEQVALGQRAFMQECHMCHPDGDGGLGPTLLRPLPSAAIRAQIRLGAGGMPRFSDEELSDAQVDAILAYLDTLRDHLK